MDIVDITGAVVTILTVIGGGIGWLIVRIENRINRLEDHHAECVKENAKLREEAGAAKAEAKALREEVAELRAEAVYMRTELDQVKEELRTERNRPRGI